LGGSQFEIVRNRSQPAPLPGSIHHSRTTLESHSTTYDEFSAAKEPTVKHHIIRGKPLALNQVIEFFRSVDEKEPEAGAK
jgi:hypothetical protein